MINSVVDDDDDDDDDGGNACHNLAVCVSPESCIMPRESQSGQCRPVLGDIICLCVCVLGIVIV